MFQSLYWDAYRKYVHKIKKKHNLQNKMPSTGKSQYLVWPPLALSISWGNLRSSGILYQVSFSSYYSYLVCLIFLSLFRWSHTASIIFRSGLCGGQSMTVSVLSALFLSKYDFTALAVWLGSLSCYGGPESSTHYNIFTCTAFRKCDADTHTCCKFSCKNKSWKFRKRNWNFSGGH